MSSQLNDTLLACVKEMNEAEYTINALLLHEYRNLLHDEITTKQALLLELIHKQKNITVRELAEKMDVSSSAISQIISKLEKMHYVKREINQSNRREILVQLDEQGFLYFVKQEQVEQDIIRRFYSKLDLEEVILLKNLTLKLRDIVEQELQPE
ncbi:MarR family winged helix-turn-helix transcriptional regulator [Brevibacillus daliensis]|uniref:MarR family winged helix-turn-helix transcriptional regulator n=1 Tax=Brevibacillus daliensis TaxID=2892995 RepID=UPI001E560B70|nr:MarR family transcriptional regulator [Brevibacillus daliensis]